jgi:cyclophilin family peptidyl-prolyl cis-trans isomerase/HEAT repeat protein
MVLIPLLISTALAGVPQQTEAMLIRLESLRVGATELAPFVTNESPDVRARAAVSLARIRRADTLSGLQALLNDPVEEVRESAAFGLSQTPGSRMLLRGRLSTEPSSRVRAKILFAIGLQGNAWDIDTLVDLIGQPVGHAVSEAEVAAAANALGQMAVRGISTVRIDRVVRALSQQTRRFSVEIRHSAAFALARIRPSGGGTEVGDELIEAARREHDVPTRALLLRAAARYPGVDVALREAAKHPSTAVRIAAARAAVSANWVGVITLLDDPEPAVKLAAITAVGGMPSLERVNLLGPIANAGADLSAPSADGERMDPKLAAAIAAISALDIPRVWWENDTARYNRVQAGLKPSLTQYMSEEQDPLIRAAATGIAADPVNLLRLATGDPNGAVRMAAANRILGDRIGINRALSLLNASDEMVLAAVADWLVEHPSPSTEAALLNLASDSNSPAVIQSATAALTALCESLPARKRGSPGSTVLLSKLLGHPDTSIRTASVALARCVKAWPRFEEYSPGLIDLQSIHELRSAVISTAYGDIVLELFPKDAPLTVHNFARLADTGFYNGLPFHRVIPDFVAQGGDPRGDGFGGPGHTIPDEVNARTFDEGTLGMALSGPDTGGSQWFVTLSPQPHLDQRYTVFGRVVHGMQVVRALLPSDRIERVSIERVMTSEVLAEDELERTTAMLQKLRSHPDNSRSKKRKAKRKAEEPAETQQESVLPVERQTVPAEDEEDPPADSLPDALESEEKDPTLNEGEKVDVIDPNAE